MADKYTGKAQDRRYSADDVDVTFNLKRCIHAAECVNRLSAVFDTEKRPWIQPENAPADDVAHVVGHCPSGALHYERKDGGPAEAAPDKNVVTLWADGPVQVHGDVAIQAAGVDITDETRVTLCRCGASDQKPFCDNSHKESGFSAAEETIVTAKATPQDAGGKLTITVFENGPMEFNGPMEIRRQDGTIIYSGDKTFLCRCGASGSKPFCDGTHKQIGFTAE